MKVYKGTDKNMVCNPGGDNPFQYEIGVTYEKPKAELCRHGFHACEAPLDVLGYYPPGEGSRYFEADLEDVSPERSIDDSKVCGKKITLGAEIGIPGLAKAHIEYVKAHTTMEHTDTKQATAGSCGAATAGSCGAATAGDSGAATSRGSSAAGREGLSVARGSNVKVKGGIGAVLVIAIEPGDSYAIKEWKADIVDGETLKPDTWYTLKNGEFVEVDD